MVSSDTVVGIVGAVILTGAMIAVFYYEADRDAPGNGGIGTGDQRFDFGFVDDESSGPSASRQMEEGENWEEGFSLPAYSYMVHVEVSWSHALADSDLVGEAEYLIELLDGDGEVIAQSDASPLHHEMTDEDARPPSMTLTVAADSEEEARSFMDEYMESDEVQQSARNWTVRVTLVDDGVAMSDPTGQLGDLRWNMEASVTVHHFSPELRE